MLNTYRVEPATIWAEKPNHIVDVLCIDNVQTQNHTNREINNKNQVKLTNIWSLLDTFTHRSPSLLSNSNSFSLVNGT